MSPLTTSRRGLLRALAAAPVAATFPMAVRAQDAAASAAGLISSSVCLVMPETTEGPYYIDPELVRADIREDKTGVPLAMKIQVVDANCQPIAGARVDIWHCDAQGNYSGYANQGSDGTLNTEGQTFLRGTLIADDSGIVDFTTIYPGWYRGRTTHIHYKVFLDETTVLTSQIFFPDALSQYLFENAADYVRDGTRDTVNKNDSIAQDAGDGAYCYIKEQSDGYVAALVVGVNPDAVSSEGAMGGAPMSPPPDGGQPPSQGGPLGGDWTAEILIPSKE